MKKSIPAIIIIVAFFLFISTKSKATGKKIVMSTSRLFSGLYNAIQVKYGMERAATAMIVLQALLNAGFSGLKLKLALAQVFHETGVLRSALVADNNFSGIMFINKPTLQKNAVKGRPFPSKEGKYFYAKFATPLDWANDLKRIISRSPGKPLEAATVQDFAHRLKLNKYYTDSEKNYSTALKKHFDFVNMLV